VYFRPSSPIREASSIKSSNRGEFSALGDSHSVPPAVFSRSVAQVEAWRAVRFPNGQSASSRREWVPSSSIVLPRTCIQGPFARQYGGARSVVHACAEIQRKNSFSGL
jgi:hypothetical protein